MALTLQVPSLPGSISPSQDRSSLLRGHLLVYGTLLQHKINGESGLSERQALSSATLPTGGVLAVTTTTSTHLLDFAARTVLRAPGTGPTGPGTRVSTLRRDHVPLRLLDVDQLRWGRPAVLVLEVTPGTTTVRTTTPVVDARWTTPPSGPMSLDLTLTPAGGLEDALAPALSVTRAWLDGKVRETPHHLGPPCQETLPVLPVLCDINDARICPVDSQPGERTFSRLQRAYVDVITSPSRAARLAAQLRGAGLLVDHWQLDQIPRGRGQVPVSIGVDGRPCTWSMLPVEVADGPADQHLAELWQKAHVEAFPSMATVLERAALLVLVDPEWGPSTRPFNALVAAAQRVQP